MFKMKRVKMKGATFAVVIIVALTAVAVLLTNFPTGSFGFFSHTQKLDGAVIAIDPGHGGVDGGAYVSKTFLEKDINLDISLKINAYLQSKGVNTVMTRDKDVSMDSKSQLKATRYSRDLDGRKNVINGSGANVFVSIHANSNRRHPATRGAIVFYNRKSEEGKKVAEAVAACIDEIVYRGYLQNTKLKTDVLPQNLYVLRRTSLPGVLVETGFLTNYADNKCLRDEGFKEKMAEAVSEGLMRYLGEKGSGEPGAEMQE